MEYRYQTKGVCSSQIILNIEGDIVKSATFVGGCNGNTKGIGALVAGMKIDDVIAKCQGIACGNRPSSCPDQLAKALIQAKAEMAAKA